MSQRRGKPAGRSIFFQALDENFRELQRERTYVNYAPGEVRSCTGCHGQGNRTANKASAATPFALTRAPSIPQPQPCDLAVIVVGAKYIPGIVAQCAQAGIRFVVILSAGFGEAGEEGILIQNHYAPKRILGANGRVTGLETPATTAPRSSPK